MALTDQVLMPGADYQAAANQVRELNGTTATLKSGEMVTALESANDTVAAQTTQINALIQQANNLPAAGAGGSITIDDSNSTNIVLANNTEYRRGAVSTLSIALPESLPNVLECQVSFTSGASPTVLTLPAGISLSGDSVNNGTITVQANRRYGLLFWYDGAVVWCVVCATSYTGSGDEDVKQDGTEAHPYLIASAAELKAFADEVDGGDNKSGKYYALSADIDLSTYAAWDPIGAKDKSSADASAGFAGTLDGRGHVVKNLNVSEMKYAGLFGTNFTGTILNLGVVSGTINTTISDSTCGAIARKSTAGTAKIVNCYSLIPCTAVARSSGLIDEMASGSMLVGCYQAGKVGGGSGYALKGAYTKTGEIHYCLWDKTLTAKGYTTTTNATNNSGLTTAEFATAASTLNANLANVATKSGIDVSKLCTWQDGTNGYPELVVMQ